MTSPIDGVPAQMREFIPGMDAITTDIPHGYTEADVAYAGLSTATLAIHHFIEAREQNPYPGVDVSAVGLGWNDQARTLGQFAGMNNVEPGPAPDIHAEVVIAAKARDYGMRLLYLAAIEPLQVDGQAGIRPCANCLGMMNNPVNREFSPRTMILSGYSPDTLHAYTLAHLIALNDAALREYVRTTAWALPHPSNSREYQDVVYRALSAQWAMIYPRQQRRRGKSS